MPPEAPAPEAPEQSGTPTSPAAPEQNGGAPAEEPQGGGSQTESPEVIDWKQRYEDLRPEADRRASLLADIEGRNGPERQAQALQEHARIELEAEEEEQEDDEFDLPPDPNEEIAKIRQELAERDEASKEAELERLEQQYCEETIEGLEGSENFKLSDEEYEFVVNRALAHRDQHDGKPDLEGSFKAFKKSILARNKGVFDSPEEPITPPLGTEGEPKIDRRDKEARQKLATEAFQAHARSQET